MGLSAQVVGVAASLGWTYVVLGLVASLLVWQSGAMLYNVFLHPLRGFPGPLINRASALPFALRWSRGAQSLYTATLHEKYGPVVRLGPNHLSFTDPRAFKDIYGHRVGSDARRAEMGKPSSFVNPIEGQPKSIISEDRDEHGQLRRALAHGFSDGSMREQEPIVTKYVDLLISRLREESAPSKGAGGVLRMDAWYNWTTFDVMGDLIFGLPFDCLAKGAYHPYIQTILENITTACKITAMQYAGLRRLSMWMYHHGFFRGVSTGTETAIQMLEHRLEMEKDREDLFDGLIKKRDQLGLDLGHLASNAWILVIAGSETTATTLSGTTYHLLKNPEVLKKVTAEVRSAFSSAQEINIATVSKLQYMLAVLNEALRMYPPVTQGLMRVVPPGDGEIIAGHHVPAGTQVEVPHWSANHSEANWADPWSFRPERFLASPEEALKAGNHLEALNPFSVGPRNCIGRNLAYAEMRLILARILFDFDLESAMDPTQDWLESQDTYVIWVRTMPLNVRLKPVR